jgi:ligand-binding sensor domain-containing protein
MINQIISKTTEKTTMKHTLIYTLFLTLTFCTLSKAQNKTAPSKDSFLSVRNIKQDRKGNIWLAAWQDIMRYDGKSFSNITGKGGSVDFVSILEDRKGNFWFGTMGSGVYYYDGKSIQIFTTREGLVNDRISSIYEDKAGNIWFGANGGVSRYDGKSFRNYIINGESVIEDKTAKSDPRFTTGERLDNEVTSIIEDKTGQFWFSTKGNTFIYDGKTFTVFNHDKKPFKNVRSIIEDRRGNKWLGGNDGLWRYDGNKLTKITNDFVGYVYEDKKGNIWTSSESTYTNIPSVVGDSVRVSPNTYNAPKWALSRYDEKSLLNNEPTVTQMKSPYDDNKGVFFGILEANDGSIWVGATNGVYRYDGDSLKRFK